MPLPAPRDSENQSDFVSRCVLELTEAGEGESNRQRVAICNSQWQKGKTMTTATEDPKQKIDALSYKMSPDAELSAKADEGDELKGNGKIVGHAAVFDNVDHQGDIIRPGAFKKTIKERIAAGKVGLMVRHMAMGGDTQETIGVITKAVEDSKGLYIEADLFDAQLAQETRGKIIKSPKMFGMSVGFKTVRSSDILNDKGEVTGKELLELALFEVTITTLPANDQTWAEAKTEVTELEQRVAALEKKLTDAAATASEGTVNTDAKRAPRSLVSRRRREIAFIKAQQED